MIRIQGVGMAMVWHAGNGDGAFIEPNIGLETGLVLTVLYQEPLAMVY